ncbi:hypothetical protein QTN25_002102 [Entamoeba marina]
MTTLEMPYIMNVIIYVENSVVPLLPFINKKCKIACDSMKINPWNNPDDVLFDVQIIQKVFSNLDTFRIDPLLLEKFEQQLPLNHYENIELDKESLSIENYRFYNDLQTKCHILFNGDEVINDRKSIYLFGYNYEILKQISQLRQVQHIYLNRDSIPSKKEAKLLNTYSKDYKITIFLSPLEWKDYFKHGIELCEKIIILTKVHGSLCVIPHYDEIDYCIHLFDNIENMMIFEKLYLPTKLILDDISLNYIDVTPFHYITKIVIVEHDILPKSILKLPYSTQKIVVKKYPYKNINTEIVNWNDLTHLQEIQDDHQLNVPYPQIKKKKFTTNHRTLYNVFQSFIELLCLMYLLMYSIFHIKSIIISSFDKNVIYQEAYNHVFYYNHLCLLTIFLHCFSNPIKSWNQVLFITMNLNILIYPYSLLSYTSSFWIYLLALFTYLLLISHSLNINKYLNITHYDVNTILNILLHGYWFKITTTKQIVNKIYPVCKNIEKCSLFFYVTMNNIGLVISFIYSTGFISYIGFILFTIFVGAMIYFVLTYLCYFLNT